jgi:outer membrane protein assembly factor BamB
LRQNNIKKEINNRMKQLFTFILFVSLFSLVKGQDYHYAWLSDIHIGTPGADADLQNAINDINSREEIKFVVITGDISEKGSNAELEKAKEMLDMISVPYYVIPGSHDTKWSESGNTKFIELWQNDNFCFDFNNIRHIGINTAIFRQGGGGHVSPETLKWLKEVLDTTDAAQPIYLYAHHPMDSTVDNGFMVTNLLKEKNTRAILTGFAEANKLYAFNGIPGAGTRSILTSKDAEVRPKVKTKKKQADVKSWGYTYVEDRPDSLIFYEVYSDSEPRRWGDIPKTMPVEVVQADSNQSAVYDEAVSVKWQKDLGFTTIAPVIAAEDRIFASTYNGIIYCYDLDGKEIWKYDTGGTIVGAPVRDKDVLAVSTYEGDLFTINANNGKVIQVLSTGENLTSSLLKITVTSVNGKFRGIIIGTAGGKLLCYDMYSLNLIWENNTSKGLVETEPLYINDRLIYGSRDGFLYCIDANSGILNWKWQGDKSFYYAPAVCRPVSDGRHVFIATPDKNVTAVDFLLGITGWKKNNFNSWESIGISSEGSSLYIKSLSDKLYIVSPSDGKVLKEINTGHSYDTTPLPPVNWNDNILMGTKSGIIYLINAQFTSRPLLFTGNARINGISNIKDNLFLAGSMDGKFFVFEMK